MFVLWFHDEPQKRAISATSPQSSRVAARDVSSHEHFVFSYEPLLKRDEEPVDAEDIEPRRGHTKPMCG